MALVIKNLPANTGDIRDAGLILGSGGSPEGEHCNPLQYSCLESPHRLRILASYSPPVTKSRIQLKRLSMHTCIGEGNGNQLQYSCLENLRDRGAWWAAVYGVAQSRTRLK